MTILRNDSSPLQADVQPIPLAEFRKRVLDLYQPPLRSRATFFSMRRSLDLLMDLDGLDSTADLTMQTIARFVASRTGRENPNTTRHHLRKLSAACSIAVGEGWLRISPFQIRRRWVRAVTPKAPRVHSREEIARILETARGEIAAAHPGQRWKARRLYALAAVVAYTGLRKTEALTLRVGDVRFREGLIALTARVGGALKTEDAAQPVPIPPDLAPILRGWIGHLDRDPGTLLFPNLTGAAPWTGGPHGSTAADCLKALGSRAGVPGVTFQSFRHSWATHAEFWGLTDAQIQRVLRHTNTQTQWHYRHAEAANLRAMVRDVRFGRDAEADRPGTTDAPPGQADAPQLAPRPVPVVPAAPGPDADPSMVDYRPIPGFPRHRIGSDRSVWTDIRRDGHEAPGEPRGPWRRLTVQRRGGIEIVSLRRDGRSHQRSLGALMRETFGTAGGPVG